jgi:hypothetical protein
MGNTLSQGRLIGLFILHQFVATWGIAIAAPYILILSLDVLPDRWTPSMRFVHWLLTETPFYPIQIGAGLCLGWILSRRFHHRVMLWIWVLPLLILCYAVIAVPTLTPSVTFNSVFIPSSASRLSHYFGWGCRPEHRCLDQLVITMPFYVSVAYSLGAFLERYRFVSHNPTCPEGEP